ncbi:ankyrin repeat protein [Xylaria arbuscula]|nr:ankyrin repeat protein [Xylaria arbuscula]
MIRYGPPPPFPQEAALHACILAGDHQRLINLLWQGPRVHDINYSFHDIGPPLHYAASRGDIESVDLLLRAGANPKIVTPGNSHNLTALGIATLHGYRDIVNIIWPFENPTKSERGQQIRQDLLVLAAREGHLPVVHLFLTLSQDWSEKTRGQAFLEATRRWRLNVVTFLLGWLRIEQSIILEALQYVIGYKPVPSSPGLSQSGAIQNPNRQSLLELLINNVANVNAHIFKDTPLIYYLAENTNSIKALEILLQKGANPTQTNAEGRSTLHVLTKSVPVNTSGDWTYAQLEQAIRLLLRYKASPSQQDKSGEAPIHWAAYAFDFRLFRLYLYSLPEERRNHVLQMRNHYGETLLHFASVACCTEIMAFLISQGLDVNAVNSNGWRPLMCTMIPSKKLFPSGPIGRTNPSMRERVEAARLLLSHGADPTTTTKEGWTLLHGLALHRGDDDLGFDLARELLSRGVDPNCRATLLTPRFDLVELDLPSGYRLPKMIARPQSWGLVSRPGLQPIHWAVERSSVGVIRALLAHKITLSPKDKEICRNMVNGSKYIGGDQKLMEILLKFLNPDGEEDKE